MSLSDILWTSFGDWSVGGKGEGGEFTQYDIQDIGWFEFNKWQTLELVYTFMENVSVIDEGYPWISPKLSHNSNKFTM